MVYNVVMQESPNTLTHLRTTPVVCVECPSQRHDGVRMATAVVEIPSLRNLISPAFWVPVCDYCLSAFKDDTRVVDLHGC